jgi:ABC-2 type transport system ATP-binding protein
MSAIALRELSHRYGALTAVDGVSLDVPEGALYGLVGPNGAGKTTIMRVICTLLVPTAGDALVQGHSVRDEPRAIRRALGYMPDTFGLYGELRVWEYLDFYARCYHVPAPSRGQTIADVLELVDLGARRDSYVRGLSRGMRQRLALARTLLHDPSVLVLDEPAAGLDPRARLELRELLRELRQLGKTILLSSHILSDLAEICSHIAILERGRLVAAGPLTEVLVQVHGGRAVRVELLPDAAMPTDLAAAFPELLQPAMQAENDRLVVRGQLAGDDAALARLLAQFVAAGLPVVAFREEHSDLEDVFMRLTEPLSA